MTTQVKVLHTMVEYLEKTTKNDPSLRKWVLEAVWVYKNEGYCDDVALMMAMKQYGVVSRRWPPSFFN